MSAATVSISEYLDQQSHLIDAALDRLVPPATEPPETIHNAMRYSLFAGGKRVRPVLCIEAARAVSGGEPGRIMDVACSLELIHTYSLIHDDLPALDNDDLRRGRPTSHKVFGEALAILAGDALLTHAFVVLGSIGDARLVQELAVASGTVGGMIAGQVHDIEGERQTPTAELLDRIHRAKTGALLRASVLMGASTPAQASRNSMHSVPMENTSAWRSRLSTTAGRLQTSEQLGRPRARIRAA